MYVLYLAFTIASAAAFTGGGKSAKKPTVIALEIQMIM